MLALNVYIKVSLPVVYLEVLANIQRYIFHKENVVFTK